LILAFLILMYVLYHTHEMVSDAQHWYKDEKYSTKVKDADGHPCFALVNKATGEAMKHSVGATHPVSVSFLDDVIFVL